MLPDFEFSCSAFNKYGLTLTEELYQKLEIYAEFLVEYNNNVNLTAITDPTEILFKHYIDSILATKYVEFPKNSSLIDVGTGAGFPSVPLKLYRNDIKITLLDSLNKRIEFLKQLCDKLEIEAEFIHERAENVSRKPEYRENFDFACARAVANMSLLIMRFPEMSSSFEMALISIGMMGSISSLLAKRLTTSIDIDIN
jgi:16S rRNA (guanine527-N7)-methyltransferase